MNAAALQFRVLGFVSVFSASFRMLMHAYKLMLDEDSSQISKLTLIRSVSDILEPQHQQGFEALSLQHTKR